MDEPTSHLDIHHQITILSLLRKLINEKNITIVAVFHDLNHALEYCDNLLLLNEGKVCRTGSPEQVITPDIIKEIYGLNIHMGKNPFTGKSYLIPHYL